MANNLLTHLNQMFKQFDHCYLVSTTNVAKNRTANHWCTGTLPIMLQGLQRSLWAWPLLRQCECEARIKAGSTVFVNLFFFLVRWKPSVCALAQKSVHYTPVDREYLWVVGAIYFGRSFDTRSDLFFHSAVASVAFSCLLRGQRNSTDGWRRLVLC